MLSVTELKNGTYYEEDGAPLVVLSYDHIKMGRGNATIKVKVRNLLTGAITNKGYISGKRVEEADLHEIDATYKYRTSSDYIFEDEDDDELEIEKDMLKDNAQYLLKGMIVKVLNYNNNPIGIRVPMKVPYRVKEAPPDARGNSANASYKEVVLANNLKVKAPMFIKEGDSIVVDTRTGTYVSRSND